MPTQRIEPCVCGGAIRARSAAVAETAIRIHNRSQMHCLWRLRREGPTADTGYPSDLSGWPDRASVPPDEARVS